MRKFKVISLAVSGNRNKIYRTHDVVDERQVHDADDLVLKGHLKEITEQSDTAEQSPLPPPPPSSDDAPGTDEKNHQELNNGDSAFNSNVSRGTDELTTDEPGDSANETVNEESEKKPGMDDIETADIRKILNERGVKFNRNASKEDLYRLFIGL